MDFDDISFEKFDGLRAEWVKLASNSAQGICALANRHRGRDHCLFRSMHCGSFNFSWRLHWEDGGEDWLIRFPLAGKSMMLDEKVQCEAALMQYIAKNTSNPVPRVIAYGRANENPTGLGPFIIMTWVEGKKMSDVLRKEGTDPKEVILDPGIDQRTLQTLYGQMAEILLELWSLDFEAIASLTLNGQSGTHSIAGRPLTIEMNELIRTCGLKESLWEDRVYHNTTDYIASLLELQSKHLEQQRNSIYDSTDCREKYACSAPDESSRVEFY